MIKSMGRIFLAIFLVIALIAVAAFAFVKLSGSPAPVPKAPQVTQKTSSQPTANPLAPNETQIIGMTFKIPSQGSEYDVSVDSIQYSNLAPTTQLTTVTVTGGIIDTDRTRGIKFWQHTGRFRLLNKLGVPYPAQIIVKPAAAGLSYTVTFTGVSVQALKDKQVNLAIATPPVVVETQIVSGEPIVVGVTPDRFRFGV